MTTKCEKCGQFMVVDERAGYAGWTDEDGTQYDAWRCADCSGWQPELTEEEIAERNRMEAEYWAEEGRQLEAELGAPGEWVYPKLSDDDVRVTDDDIPW